MKYRVHLFVSVRVPIEVEADSGLEALQKAEEEFAPYMISGGEYAEEMLTPACIDPLLPDGEVDYDNSVWLPDKDKGFQSCKKGPNMGVFRGWSVNVSDQGGYLYVRRLDKPGDIHLKAEDEGFVVDIWNDDKNVPEVIASTCCEYNDLLQVDDNPQGGQ